MHHPHDVQAEVFGHDPGLPLAADVEFHRFRDAEPCLADCHGYSSVCYPYRVAYGTGGTIGVGVRIGAYADGSGQHMPLFDHDLMGYSLAAQIVEISNIVFAHCLAPFVEHGCKLRGRRRHKVVRHADYPIFVENLVHPKFVQFGKSLLAEIIHRHYRVYVCPDQFAGDHLVAPAVPGHDFFGNRHSFRHLK